MAEERTKSLIRSMGAAAVLETAAETPPAMKSIWKQKNKGQLWICKMGASARVRGVKKTYGEVSGGLDLPIGREKQEQYLLACLQATVGC